MAELLRYFTRTPTKGESEGETPSHTPPPECEGRKEKLFREFTLDGLGGMKPMKSVVSVERTAASSP